jgi:hypothetical protein
VEKYGRTRPAADDNIIRCMRFGCWKTKAADTHSEYVVFHYFSTAIAVTQMFQNVTFTAALPLLITVLSRIPHFEIGHYSLYS